MIGLLVRGGLREGTQRTRGGLEGVEGRAREADCLSGDQRDHDDGASRSRSPPAELVGLYPSVNRGTSGRDCVGKRVTTAEAPATISTSVLATLSPVAVMTAIDDGDDDLIVPSGPKSGDSLNIFVADFGNAGSYVNAVRKNQDQKTERRKDLACYSGVASFEGLENNDVGQRWEKNIVEHNGIGEVDDDGTLEYDDQEVEWYHDDVGGGRDLADNEEYAAESDQEHEDYDEERCSQNDGWREAWTQDGGCADGHAEHVWESGYAEWNAEEDEGDEGKDDHGEYGDGRWGSDGNRHGEEDDKDTWAVDMW